MIRVDEMLARHIGMMIVRMCVHVCACVWLPLYKIANKSLMISGKQKGPETLAKSKVIIKNAK